MVAYQPTTKLEPKIRRTFASQSDDKVWLRGFSVYGKPVPFPGAEFSGWSQPQRDNTYMNMDKNNMKPYVFKHPVYGPLRVVVMDGVVYYDLDDVSSILKKSPNDLYKAIALSDGELKNFNIVMLPHDKQNTKPFFDNEEMGVARKRKKTVAVNRNFFDGQLVADLVSPDNFYERLAFKWMVGYVKKLLVIPEMLAQHEAQEVEALSDNSIKSPNIIVLRSYGLRINGEYF